MIALVTGAAGFIGSSIVDKLLTLDWRVRGVDSFTSYYDRRYKEANLSRARRSNNFDFFEADLLSCDLSSLLEGVDVVLHLAGQPGVRPSWGPEFRSYLELNVLLTQRLLEACRDLTKLRAFINSSSSSVYGDQTSFPITENHLPQPVSPYGVTKLAAEHLCTLYRSQFGVPTVSLRYFTVYGPRQRPDMAIHRLIDSAINDREFSLNGDGSQRRDFSFVADVVDANLQTMSVLLEGGMLASSYNVGRGGTISMNELIEKVSRATGREIQVSRVSTAHGDPNITYSDSSKLQSDVNWIPTVDLDEGLISQVEFQLKLNNI